MSIFEDVQRDHRQPHRPVSQGEPMSHLASARAAAEHAAMRLAELGSNRLLTALDDEGLGAYLTDADVGHVVAIVRSLEEPHRQVQANVPPRPENGNGTRQTGAQKQVTP